MAGEGRVCPHLIVIVLSASIDRHREQVKNVIEGHALSSMSFSHVSGVHGLPSEGGDERDSITHYPTRSSLFLLRWVSLWSHHRVRL